MLYKRGNIWWAKFKAGGEYVYKSTGTRNRRDAEKIARLIRSKYDAAKPVRHHGKTLLDVAAAEIERSAAASSVPDHARQTANVYWKHILRALGPDTLVRTISNETVRDLVPTLLENLSGQTARKCLFSLRRGLEIALERRWIPMMLVEVWPKVKSTETNEARAGKLHPPEILQAWIRELNDAARDMVVFLLLTALRRTELSRIRFDWIEPIEGDLFLKMRASGTKTRKERLIPMGPQALAIVERQLRRRGDDPLIFGTETYRQERERALKVIKYKRSITLRDLRHIAATMAEQAGDRKAVQDLLGHTTEKMTLNYLHSDAKRLTAASEALAERVERLG